MAQGCRFCSSECLSVLTCVKDKQVQRAPDTLIHWEKSKMRQLRFIITFVVYITLLLFFSFKDASAQAPSPSSPQKEGCFDGNGRRLNCGDSYAMTYKGVVYDCRCNCSGEDECTPRSQSGSSSGTRPQGERQGDYVIQQREEDNAAIEAERERQIQEQERIEKEQQDKFAKDQQALTKGLKGGTSTGSPALKTGTTALPLKGYSNSSSIGLKTGNAPTKEVDYNSPQQRQEILGNLSNTIRERIDKPNEQAQEILKSLKAKAPPSLVKNINNLAPGDVILVAAIPLKDYKKAGIWEVGKSNAINLVDQWGSNNWSSPASHAAIFLGERNGKRWYLDNTSEHGPVIKEESYFLKEYGGRDMDVATLVGQPISEHQGLEIWKAAHEMVKMVSYGIWSNDKMVCSETSRWVLVRAGRRVPETQSENKKILGVDIGLNKNEFVNFSPSDFYDNEQYFVIHPLSMQSSSDTAQDKNQ
jgi:hypothetical protein